MLSDSWWWVYSLSCIHVRSKLHYFSRIVKWRRCLFSKLFHGHTCLDLIQFLEFDLMNNVELQCLFGNNCSWGACSCSDVWWRICPGRARVKSDRRGKNPLGENSGSQASDLLPAFTTSTPLAIISLLKEKTAPLVWGNWGLFGMNDLFNLVLYWKNYLRRQL